MCDYTKKIGIYIKWASTFIFILKTNITFIKSIKYEIYPIAALGVMLNYHLFQNTEDTHTHTHTHTQRVMQCQEQRQHELPYCISWSGSGQEMTRVTG